MRTCPKCKKELVADDGYCAGWCREIVMEPLNVKATPAVAGAAICSAASPALTHQSKGYPANYRGRVPKKIRMAKTLYPDDVCGISLGKPGTMLELDQVYFCWVNSNGAVAGWCDNGEKLGVKPGEFDVVEWYDAKPPNRELKHGEDTKQ